MPDTFFQPTWVDLLGLLCLGPAVFIVGAVVVAAVLATRAGRRRPVVAPPASSFSGTARRRPVPTRPTNDPPAREGHCPECGTQLPPDSPDGLCPQCLLQGGLGSPNPNGTPRTTPYPGPFQALPPHALAPAF